MLTIEQKLIELGFTQDSDYLDESIARDLVGDTLLESRGWLIAEDDCTMDIWAFSPNDEVFYYPIYEKIFERDPDSYELDEDIFDYDDLRGFLCDKIHLLEVVKERDNIVDQIKQHITLFFKDENQLELSLGA